MYCLLALSCIDDLGLKVPGSLGQVGMTGCLLVGFRFQPSDGKQVSNFPYGFMVCAQYNGRALRDYVKLCGTLMVPICLYYACRPGNRPDYG